MQQFKRWPSDDEIKRHDPIRCHHGVLRLRIGNQQTILITKPSVSKSTPMKLKTTLQHELADFRQRWRLAVKGRLGGDDASRAAFSAHAFDLPSNGKFVVQQPDAFQILIQRSKAVRTEFPTKLTSVRCFDDAQSVGGKPDFVLGASCLTKSRWKTGWLQFHRENQRFQNGSAEAVSRPTASKSRNWAAHSASVKGRWLSRYSATRWRSAARFSSMLASPADMS